MKDASRGKDPKELSWNFQNFGYDETVEAATSLPIIGALGKKSKMVLANKVIEHIAGNNNKDESTIRPV